MQEIYTSYLNNRVDWKSLGITTVRVCVWVHAGQEDRYEVEGKYLYPPADLVDRIKKKQISWETYVEEYTTRVLDKQNANDLVAFLPEKTVFLCHESTNDHCHRRLIGEWIERATDIRVREWKDPQQMQQDDLVDSLIDF